VYLFLALLHAFVFQVGWVQPQQLMEKLHFHLDLTEAHDLPSFSTTKIHPSNKPKSNAKRQKKT
jgi:hypothetical protein